MELLPLRQNVQTTEANRVCNRDDSITASASGVGSSECGLEATSIVSQETSNVSVPDLSDGPQYERSDEPTCSAKSKPQVIILNYLFR